MVQMLLTTLPVVVGAVLIRLQRPNRYSAALRNASVLDIKPVHQLRVLIIGRATGLGPNTGSRQDLKLTRRVQLQVPT